MEQTYKFACRCGETFETRSMSGLTDKLKGHDCPLDRSFWKKVINFVKKVLTGF